MGPTHLGSFAEERSFCRTFQLHATNNIFTTIWTIGATSYPKNGSYTFGQLGQDQCDQPACWDAFFPWVSVFFNSKRSEASKLQPKMIFSLNRKFSKASKSIKLFNKRATWYQRQLSILKSCHPGHDIPHKYTIMHICTWLKAWIPCLEYVD